MKTHQITIIDIVQLFFLMLSEEKSSGQASLIIPMDGAFQDLRNLHLQLSVVEYFHHTNNSLDTAMNDVGGNQRKQYTYSSVKIMASHQFWS